MRAYPGNGGCDRIRNMGSVKFTIRIPKEELRIKPRSGVKQSRVHKRKTVYKRRLKYSNKDC